jgi:hypothetical protein
MLSDKGHERLKNQHDGSRLSLAAVTPHFLIPGRVTRRLGVEPTGTVANHVLGLAPG